MRDPSEAAERSPRATYRLQLRPDFGFDAARRVVPYLARLGVSHLYASPILQAAPGSTHGYDVIDPRHVNEELGGEAGWQALQDACARHSLGIVLDIVPNHMAITPGNPWWWDVLENGRSSRFARTFDVEWEHPEPTLRDTILMPILGDHYGRVLEDGALRIAREGAAFLLEYGEHRLPLAPRSLDELLEEAARRADSDELSVLAAAFSGLPPSTADDRLSVRRRHRDKEVLRALLDRLLDERPDVAAAVDEVLAAVNADVDRLDALLERQNHRLAYWRTAGRELGYRRFFDITTLAGLRIEDEQVFLETHERILLWLADGAIDGVRVDHPDGLRDPGEYLVRLRRSSPTGWVVIEKILEPQERLRPWPVAGTTGYDFLHRLDGLFIDPAAEEPMRDAFARFTGEERSFQEISREAKVWILREVLASELNRLTALALRVTERHRRHRDHTRHDVHEALREIAASFPVYRSYVRAEAGEVAPDDEHVIGEAVADARRRRDDLAPDLFDFLADVLALRLRGALESEMVMRFQQLTGAVMAKGVEDTAFYVYTPLLSLNEVGGDPGEFGLGVERFHLANREQQEHWPTAMLATSTHDTKRSEDVRARLHVLSELPAEWSATVDRWHAANERHRRDGLPDGHAEWFLYQTLVGAWPIDPGRAWTAMEKSVREAKRVTSWTRPDEPYEQALRAFIDGILADEGFCRDVAALVERLDAAGRVNSVAMTLLKLTAPGVPDLYQGTELWDHSLVDPDNRRAVDFSAREALIDELPALTAEHVLARTAQGLPKLWVAWHALRVRRERAAAFGRGPEGVYEPLEAWGERAGHLVGFVRGGSVAVLVPRLSVALRGDWRDTRVRLPDGRWHDELSGDEWAGGELAVGDILRRFPVALLVRDVDG